MGRLPGPAPGFGHRPEPGRGLPAELPPGLAPPGGGQDPPTRQDTRRHPDPAFPYPRRLTVTRVAAARSRELTTRVVRRIGAASRAEGAGESGLTGLIWTNATQVAGDAMIAVCLAGTIFFSAATNQQRTNVAMYLLITMAPFALVAPVLGPLLDRMHRGRRLALAGTMLGRALLAFVMAANFDNLGLYPAAFGTLVLSKAYGVLKGACVPRVLPDRMTLVAANARLSLFGLGASLTAGGLIGGFIKLSDSYPWALRITMCVFAVGAVQSLRLPAHVDSSYGEDTATILRQVAGPTRRRWRRGPLGARVVIALRSAGALRGMSGFLTMFMAFLIQSHQQGVAALLSLGALVGAISVGSVVGTAMGARIRPSTPDVVVPVCVGVTAAMCVLAAVSYSIVTAVLVALAASVANSLGKLCLDAIIQHEVADTLRASAFGRSETLLQLSWVFGGGLGIALPSNGQIGFTAAAVVLFAAFVLALTSRRGLDRAEATGPGSLGATDPHPAG